jgi:arylsulfatase A-like enzyme
MREATVVRWPGQIPAGLSNDKLMTAMDLLPTFAALAGAEVPKDRVIDGKDLWPALVGDANTPHEAFFYHAGNQLTAVRSGKWKLHRKAGKPSFLYDLEADIGETQNLLKANPDVAQRLQGYVTEFEKDLTENSRSAAFVEKATPLTLQSIK